MGVDVIQVDYQRLKDLIQKIHAQSEVVNTNYQRLMESMDDLRGGGWEADAAQNFYISMDNDVFPGIRRLSKALEGTAMGIKQIALIMRDAEEEAAVTLSMDDDKVTAVGKIIGDDNKNQVRLSGMRTITNPRLFLRGRGDGGQSIHPSDAKQGQLGDCYFVTSLAVVAQHNPDLIRNNIRDNGDGTYTVTLYEEISEGNYRAVQETVNLEIPTAEQRPIISRLSTIEKLWPPENWFKKDEFGEWSEHAMYQPHMGIDDQHGDHQEVWALVYEKAYMQRFMDGDTPLEKYYQLDQGGHTRDALTALTGQPSKELGLIEPINIDRLAQLHEAGYGLTLSSKSSIPDDSSFYVQKEDQRHAPLTTKHAYYISDINRETGEVTVRNPWGWRDTDNTFTIPFDQLDENFRKITLNPLSERDN